MRDQAYGLRRLVAVDECFSAGLCGSLADKLTMALAILKEIDEKEEIHTVSILTSVRTAKRALVQAVKRV